MKWHILGAYIFNYFPNHPSKKSNMYPSEMMIRGNPYSDIPYIIISFRKKYNWISRDNGLPYSNKVEWIRAWSGTPGL